MAASLEWKELAAEIEENYLIHRFRNHQERYKVFPRSSDRQSYFALVDHNGQPATGQILAAYVYFSKMLADADEQRLKSSEELRSLSKRLSVA